MHGTRANQEAAGEIYKSLRVIEDDDEGVDYGICDKGERIAKAICEDLYPNALKYHSKPCPCDQDFGWLKTQ